MQTLWAKHRKEPQILRLADQTLFFPIALFYKLRRAVKEQQTEIDELKARMDKLEALLQTK